MFTKTVYNIRNSERYAKEGINVNFVEEIEPNKLFVRTYERGVEDETYSCGTGVTACAATYMKNHKTNKVEVKVLGGNLKKFMPRKTEMVSKRLVKGYTKQVLKGKINI